MIKIFVSFGLKAINVHSESLETESTLKNRLISTVGVQWNVVHFLKYLKYLIPNYFSQTVWVLLPCFRRWVSFVGICSSYPRLSGQLTLLDGALKHQELRCVGCQICSFKCYGIKQSVNHTIFVFIYGKEELLGFLKMGEKLCRLRSGVSHLIVIILKRINLYNCP